METIISDNEESNDDDHSDDDDDDDDDDENDNRFLNCESLRKTCSGVKQLRLLIITFSEKKSYS